MRETSMAESLAAAPHQRQLFLSAVVEHTQACKYPTIPHISSPFDRIVSVDCPLYTRFKQAPIYDHACTGHMFLIHQRPSPADWAQHLCTKHGLFLDAALQLALRLASKRPVDWPVPRLEARVAGASKPRRTKAGVQEAVDRACCKHACRVHACCENHICDKCCSDSEDDGDDRPAAPLPLQLPPECPFSCSWASQEPTTEQRRAAAVATAAEREGRPASLADRMTSYLKASRQPLLSSLSSPIDTTSTTHSTQPGRDVGVAAVAPVASGSYAQLTHGGGFQVTMPHSGSSRFDQLLAHLGSCHLPEMEFMLSYAHELATQACLPAIVHQHFPPAPLSEQQEEREEGSNRGSRPATPASIGKQSALESSPHHTSAAVTAEQGQRKAGGSSAAGSDMDTGAKASGATAAGPSTTRLEAGTAGSPGPDAPVAITLPAASAAHGERPVDRMQPSAASLPQTGFASSEGGTALSSTPNASAKEGRPSTQAGTVGTKPVPSVKEHTVPSSGMPSKDSATPAYAGAAPAAAGRRRTLQVIQRDVDTVCCTNACMVDVCCPKHLHTKSRKPPPGKGLHSLEMPPKLSCGCPFQLRAATAVDHAYKELERHMAGANLRALVAGEEFFCSLRGHGAAMKLHDLRCISHGACSKAWRMISRAQDKHDWYEKPNSMGMDPVQPRPV